MAETHESPGEARNSVFQRTLAILEGLDNLAHMIVAALFILMAASVILYTMDLFVRQTHLIADTFQGKPAQTTQASAHTRSDPGSPDRESIAGGDSRTPADTSFYSNSLELLSSILFAVILLELLRTIITFIKTSDLQVIMKEFLAVGIISSIRKILLVGAQSSLEGGGDKGNAFIKEASGTVISIAGILLLIVGLVVLQRTHNSGDKPTSHEAPPQALKE